MKTFVESIVILLFFFITAAAVSATCQVSTMPVNFGSYDVASANPLDSEGHISVTCTDIFWVTVSISIGASPNSGGFNPRKMKNNTPPDYLNYNLFTDASSTTIWGDGTQGTSTMSDMVQVNKPWTLPVYGRIPGVTGCLCRQLQRYSDGYDYLVEYPVGEADIWSVRQRGDTENPDHFPAPTRKERLVAEGQKPSGCFAVPGGADDYG
jgi:spore coat protein U-like protein